MLFGMTVPPVGRDDDKVPGPGPGGGAETDERPDGAGNGAGDAAEQVQDEQVRSAALLEERSYRHVQQEKHRTAEARGRAAEAHHRAARLHDQQADRGWGDVKEHRAQAHEHREEAEAGGAGAGPDQSADREDP
jgi:hypothetical protein